MSNSVQPIAANPSVAGLTGSELYPTASRTLDPPGQNSGPRIGPLVISEVMYQPRDPGDGIDPRDMEFIEIHNPTFEPVGLTGWKIDVGIEYFLADGMELGPYGTLLVLSFDPADLSNADRVQRFRQTYALQRSKWFSAVSVHRLFPGAVSRFKKVGRVLP